MRDAVIVDAVRTPVGKRKGALAEVHPVDLSAVVLRALVERTGLDPADVDDVIWGVVSQGGDQAFNVGRSAVLAAGWPESVPGTTVDRQCGSSQQALHFAAAGLISGQYDVAVAGGVEHMTRVPMGSTAAGGTPWGRSVLDRYGVAAFNQGISAETIAAKWGFSRTQLDEFSLASHAKAAAAIDSGRLAAQLVPVQRSDAQLFDRDEGVRRDTGIEQLSGLQPAFVEDGVVTAGNSSQLSDAAAALLLTTSEVAAARGWRPLARVHTAVLAAEDPVIMLTAPIPATQKALARAGLVLDDIGVFEVNEAFASVPLAWLAETGAPADRLNPDGGAIAIGHPLGASGARIATTLVHHLRDHRIRYGLQTMCEGGGMANATIFELL